MDAHLVRYTRAALAPATLRAYESDWRDFSAWCSLQGLTPAGSSPSEVGRYISHMAMTLEGQTPAFSPATIARRLAAISHHHRSRGLPDPTRDPLVQSTMRGIRRELTSHRPTRRARALLLEDIEQMIASMPFTWPSGVGSVRDRAIVLLGWVGAFRRSEIAALAWADIENDPQGLLVHVRWSKTREPMIKAVPVAHNLPHLCPVCAVCRWQRLQRVSSLVEKMAVVLDAGGHDHDLDPHVDPSTPVFTVMGRGGDLRTDPMSPGAISAVVTRRAQDAGLEGNLSGHSLRAGFVTQALASGASFAHVMHQSGHTNPATVEVYNRNYNPFESNAVTHLGL